MLTWVEHRNSSGPWITASDRGYAFIVSRMQSGRQELTIIAPGGSAWTGVCFYDTVGEAKSKAQGIIDALPKETHV